MTKKASKTLNINRQSTGQVSPSSAPPRQRHCAVRRDVTRTAQIRDQHAAARLVHKNNDRYTTVCK